jgi:hypothetical protein
MDMALEYSQGSPDSTYLANWIPGVWLYNIQVLLLEGEGEPEEPTVTFSDDFNRVDSSDLGDDWVEVSGDWSIVSNQLSPGLNNGTVILRAATEMASDDNYAQVTIANTAVASHGVWCRGNTTFTSGYLWRNDGTSWNLFSVVGGSFTSIDSHASAAVSGDIAKVQAIGSTIKGFVNGVELVSVTNTHVETGMYVGLRSDTPAGLRYDDFSGSEAI